jgi:hypothetical protein
MSKKQLLTLLLCLPLLGMAQTWQHTYGDNTNHFGSGVQQTIDGGHIVCGSKESGNGNTDVYLLKTDASGVEQWSNTFGGSGNDYAYYIEQTTDGGYIMCGVTSSFGNGLDDIYLIKTDGNGVESWSQTFGGSNNDKGCSVQQTTDGGYIICGFTSSFGNGLDDTYLIKTNANGIESWSQTFGGSNYDQGWSVQQTTDGGYIVSGLSMSFGLGNIAVYLIKTDASGVEQWNQTYGGSASDLSICVQQTIDGGYIIAGQTNSFGAAGDNMYLIKTDVNGVEEWEKTFGGDNRDVSMSVQQTIDSGYILCGSTKSIGNGNYDVYLIKTDENGIESWSQTFGGNEDDGGWFVQQTTDGGYIICGDTESFGGGESDLYLIKTDGNGYVTSSFTIPISTEKGEIQKITNYLGQETKPTKNTPLLYQYENGTIEKKIIIE